MGGNKVWRLVISRLTFPWVLVTILKGTWCDDSKSGSRGQVKSGQLGFRALSAAIFCILSAILGGCAIGGKTQTATVSAPVVERDLLAEAASQVEVAQWPKPEPAPLFSWITGDRGDDRVSKSEAVAFYVDHLMPKQARFEALSNDVTGKLGQAGQLHRLAVETVDASRVSMGDIAILEQAIQTLREHRDIYVEAAKELDDNGEEIDAAEIKAIRLRFNDVIADLADAADLLADKIDNDLSSTYAAPAPSVANNLSDL